MGIAELLQDVASMCADKVVLPPDVNCCGFAGEKGFHIPDLNAHGLRKAVPVIKKEEAVVLGIQTAERVKSAAHPS